MSKCSVTSSVLSSIEIASQIKKFFKKSLAIEIKKNHQKPQKNQKTPKTEQTPQTNKQNFPKICKTNFQKKCKTV